MAAGDQLVIRATPAGPLNAGYTTSASQSIEVTSAVATFDGTNAAGGFEPALAFYDANGVLLNRAMCKTTIAAGSSAEVSFFPFVQASSAGSTPVSSTPDGESLQANPPLILNAFNTHDFSFAYSSGTAMLDLTTPTTPKVPTRGVYSVIAAPTASGPRAQGLVSVTLQMWSSILGIAGIGNPDIGGGSGFNPIPDLPLTWLMDAGDHIEVFATNSDVIQRTISCDLWVAKILDY